VFLLDIARCGGWGDHIKHFEIHPLTPALSLRERGDYAKRFVFHFVIARRGGVGCSQARMLVLL